MRVWVPVVALGFLAGCAASHPMVVSSPIPDEVGWSAPQVEPVEVTPPPPVPERPASPVEQVHPFEEGAVYKVLVAVKTPMVVMLQAGERIDHVAQDRTIIPEGEEGSPWTVSESKAHTPPTARRHHPRHEAGADAGHQYHHRSPRLPARRAQCRGEQGAAGAVGLWA